MDNMKIGLNALILSLIVSLIAIGSCSAGDARDKDPLVVGVNPDYRPVAFKENEKLLGIEPSMAQEIGKLLNREIQFRNLEWDELIPSLQKGDIDVIMSGMSITEERLQVISYTEPYMEIGQMAIIRIADVGRLSQPAAIFQPGVNIGVEPGTTGATFAKEKLTAATVKYFENPPQSFAALRSKDIDFYIHDAPTSWKLAQTSEHGDMISLYRPLTKESLAWAVKKGNVELLNQLNSALAKLRANGILARIQDHWIPVKVEVGN